MVDIGCLIFYLVFLPRYCLSVYLIPGASKQASGQAKIINSNIDKGYKRIHQQAAFFKDDQVSLGWNLLLISRGHPLKLSIPLTKLNTRKYFFVNCVIPIWNSLPAETVMAPSISSFERPLHRTNSSKYLIFPTVFSQHLT